ncbi:MAG: twin-arginine translocase subunit TatC, partial [Myxococcota bacterium]
MKNSHEPDGQQLTLVEHLDELRNRLIKAILAVLATTSLCLAFAPQILDYSVKPLRAALAERTRVETVLVYPEGEAANTLGRRLSSHPRVRMRGQFGDISEVTNLVQAASSSKAPVDLVLVSATSVGSDGALVSDLLEGVDPTPYVAYLVDSPQNPA